MQPQKLRICTYSTLDELHSVLPAWEELLSAYPLTTTFSTWEWLSSWWRAFGSPRELLVVAFFDLNSQLVALAPLSLERQRMAIGPALKLLRLMGDGSGDSDNLDMPVLPGWEENVANALLLYLQHNKVWDITQFNTLPSESPVLHALVRNLRQPRWAVVQQRRLTSAIPLPDCFDAYLQQLSNEDKKNFARYTRRLEKRYQTRIYRCEQEAELPRCLEALFQLHQARWQAAGKPGTFASRERRRFYFDLSRSLLARGWLEMWVLELNGTIAAVQYAFRYGSTVFQLQEGFNPAHSSDRLGFILRGHVIERLIAEGVRTYDFLAGEPRYKGRWLAQARYYEYLHFARSYSLGSVYLHATNNAKNGKAWLRKHLPQRAWAMLHGLNVGLQRAFAGKMQAQTKGNGPPTDDIAERVNAPGSAGTEKR